MSTNYKKVRALLAATEIDMGGMPVRQPFPTKRFPDIDPFLLLHHADIKVPQHRDPTKTGVGPHPHRGFSPVTFVFKGGVHHRDSRGNSQAVYAGGTQWMHAGMGIVHSERPPEDIFDQGGRQEIIQLWVNSPAKHKMDQPSYFPLTAEDTPKVILDNGKVVFNIVSGEFMGTKGPIPTLSPVTAATGSLQAGGSAFISVQENYQSFLYLLDGKIRIDGYGIVEGENAVLFDTAGKDIGIEALEDTRVLWGSGQPIGEKIMTYGTYVMNDQTQILEAMRDYQMGKMGVLVE